jgi:Tol biopolymer transport system component/imidazolonepropionase-like amidohydrolase
MFCLTANINATEITFTEGTNFGISLSPDGQTIAMDTQGILWTLPSKGGKARPLTSGQQPEAREPSWSPDGKRITFQGFYQGYFHIWTIDIDGKNLKQITSGKYDDREPSWNADGKSIVFASDRSGNYDIWEIDLSTGKETQLTTNRDDDAHPHKSFDGKRLLHTREIKGSYSEIILRENNKEASLFRSEQVSFFRPSWNTDNKGFSYIYNNDNEIKLNFISDVNSREAEMNAVTLDQGDIFPFRAVWTKDNGVYYTADGAIKHINKNGQQGDKIAFNASITSNLKPYKRKAVNFQNDKSQPVLGVGSLDVSPANNEMVYTALGDMWLQKGSDKPQNIDPDKIGHVVDPTWSNDGSKLAFVAERDGQMDIWIRNMKTGAEKKITNDEGREYRLTWSPDDKSIVYLSARSSTSNSWGRVNLKIIDTDYGSINTIDENIFTPGRPTWSPDGKSILIAFVKPSTSRFREGMHSIKRYAVDTHRASFLDMPNDIGLSTRDGSGPVISPDGLKMVYVSEGELRTVTINGAGDITGQIENKCFETAHMPRWSNDSETVYYFAGKRLQSCNINSGTKTAHTINLEWKKKFAEDKTIHVGKFFDGVAKEYKTNVDVFISKNVITKITPHGEQNIVGTFHDYSDKTIIPGIIAGHSHQSELMGERLGRNWLAYGITGVRDPGTNPYKSLMRKETWESGNSMGPHMYYAGWLTGGARVYYGQSYNAINEKALRHELVRAKELNYDLLKSYVRLPDEFQQILVSEGHKMGIPVTGHEISAAVQNGVDAVEHMGATSRRGYSPKFSSLSKSYNDVMEIISKSGQIITPTATLMSGFNVYMGRYPEYVNQPRSKTFLDELQRNDLNAAVNSPFMKSRAESNPFVLKSIKTLHDKGAYIAAGTDSPFIPYGIAQLFELVMFVDAGLTPYEAIRSATINVAKLIGVDKSVGTLEVGKAADMVVLDGDPLNNITDIFNVDATIKDGQVFTKEEMIIDRTSAH